ncbi:MAG TPA: methionyl-tRNA formyltransferase [Candidatus Paceibacterota bacterium]|nr:methionyl-tRNA formyltransferase [Candidatus Paceibacterota bacterium]
MINESKKNSGGGAGGAVGAKNSGEKIRFVFFGTDSFATTVLDQLNGAGLLASIIVTAPDRPAGRGNKIQKPATKIWAEKNNIPVLQPEKLNDDFYNKIKNDFGEFDFFVVASYGKIIPERILSIPKKGTLNVHPSLLPLYRGASPIESAMLDDQKETGVTIMQMDKEMDHGPILSQEVIIFDEWPQKTEVEEKMAIAGGKLLVETIFAIYRGEIEPQEQDHSLATFTKKIEKSMGIIPTDEILDFVKSTEDSKNQRNIFLKIQALNPWPGAYFFIKHSDKKSTADIRVKITEASFEPADGDDASRKSSLKIKKVIPEGKKEMTFDDFCRGFLQN